MKKYLFLSCLFAVSNVTFADDCKFFAKFLKSDNGYIVESASNNYIDSEDVLVAYINREGRLTDLKVPYKEFNGKNWTCRSVGSNDYQALCGGEFVSKNVGEAAAAKPLLYALTLGLGAVVDASNGFVYSTRSDTEHITMAKESSDIYTSSYTVPYFAQCQNYYKNLDQQESDSKKQQAERAKQEALKQQQQADSDKAWLNSMTKYRTKAKAGDVTNCGTIIEVKGTMAHVQTGSDARDVWLPLTSIYSQTDNQGRYVGCADSNRWYKRYGNWVTVNSDGFANFIQNGQRYNDNI